MSVYQSKIEELFDLLIFSLERFYQLDEIIRQAQGVKGFLKTLLGAGKDMNLLLTNARVLSWEWETHANRSDKFRGKYYDRLDEGEKNFVDMLCEFSIAMKQTTNALVYRQQLLSEPKVNFAHYQLSARTYELAVEHHKNLQRKIGTSIPWDQKYAP
jgi:hypothetical protein